jgi:hypothetical protein
MRTGRVGLWDSVGRPPSILYAREYARSLSPPAYKALVYSRHMFSSSSSVCSPQQCHDASIADDLAAR